MQQSMPIHLLSGQKIDSSTDYAQALPVNVSGVVEQVLGAAGYLLQMPGLTAYGGTPPGTDRGGLWNERLGNLYRVSGQKLISVDPDGNVAELGTVVGAGQMAMPYSFQTQAVIGLGNYYLYDTTLGFRQVTDTDLGAVIDGVWVDGYYFMTDGEYLLHTDLTDESAIDPLKFATSEFSPDPTKGVGLTADNKVMAFNRYTIEYFLNQANAQFAFTRISARTVLAGIVGTHCKVQIAGVWYILGGAKEANISIHAVGVGSTTPIASRQVDKILSAYTEADLASVVLETRTVDTYPYLIVHLPNEVLIFNFKVAAFAGVEKAWTVLVSNPQGTIPYRAINGVFDPRSARWVYGDKYTQILTYLDKLVATHYGEMAECVMYTPFAYLETASIDELEIATVSGFTSNDDATVFFSMTYNGITYSMEASLEYGGPSAYNQRFIARALGYVDDLFAFKFRWVSRSRMAFSEARILYG